MLTHRQKYGVICWCIPCVPPTAGICSTMIFVDQSSRSFPGSGSYLPAASMQRSADESVSFYVFYSCSPFPSCENCTLNHVLQSWHWENVSFTFSQLGSCQEGGVSCSYCRGVLALSHAPRAAQVARSGTQKLGDSWLCLGSCSLPLPHVLQPWLTALVLQVGEPIWISF